MKQILLFALILSLVICDIKTKIKHEEKQLLKPNLNLFKKYINLRKLNDNLILRDEMKGSETKSSILSIIGGLSILAFFLFILGRLLS